jgi:ATP-dependent RNA circularization protein (DNA/RNA ligase family)
VKDDFFKFPSTPHLATLAGVDIRGDKVLTESECNEFLQHYLVVEEKIDGANFGISFDSEGNIRVQNRGAYLHLPGSGQWKKIGYWLAPRTDTLLERLSDNFILFGEWCYAQHSVFYDHLPDWFLGFDVYDKRFGRFFSSERRDALLREMCIAQVPVVARGHFAYPEIKNLLSTSRLSDQPAEGIYLRFDQDDWLAQRAKLVRPAFIQALEQHWSRSGIRPNRLRLEVQG